MRYRLAIACGLLVGALLLLFRFEYPDFAQDYAAAWGWWHGMDSNAQTARLLATCCAALPQHYPNMQTAHPPLATLLALPLALLPWAAARVAWLVVSWAAILAAWQIGRVGPVVCLVTASFWLIALVLGTHEPLLFALLALAIAAESRAPSRAGALIGLCAALKAYPALLLVGLWMRGQRRAVAAGLLACVAAIALCELVLGFGATRAWLAYVPVNTARYVDEVGNLSLVHLVRQVAPGVSPLLIGMVAAALLLLPLIPRLRRGDGLRPLVPTMLLVSPLSWRHYMGLVALGPIARVEQICLAVSGVTTLLVGMDLIPSDNLAPIIQGPLLVALVLMWYRLARPQRSGRKAMQAPARDGQEPVLRPLPSGGDSDAPNQQPWFGEQL